MLSIIILIASKNKIKFKKRNFNNEWWKLKTTSFSQQNRTILFNKIFCVFKLVVGEGFEPPTQSVSNFRSAN
jgi:hypothetical protein